MNPLWDWPNHDHRSTECHLSSQGHRDRGVFTGHNVREALQLFERDCKFSEGKTLEDGQPERVAVSKKAHTLYPRKNFGLMKHEGTKPLTEHEDELNHEE
jgi:hypothetical protein